MLSSQIFSRKSLSYLSKLTHVQILILCGLVSIIVYLPALWLSFSVALPSVSASSRLENYGPDGLFISKQPGWHAEKKPNYPQTIDIQFNEQRSISIISLFPQDNNYSRAPKTIRVNYSDDGKTWVKGDIFDELCLEDGTTDFVTITTNKPLRTRSLQLEILANCGDPNFLTLKGLRVE